MSVDEPTDDDTVNFDLPATRGELMTVVRLTHLALLSNSLFYASLLEGDEEQQREFAARTIDAGLMLTTSLKKMIASWKDDDG